MATSTTTRKKSSTTIKDLPPNPFISEILDLVSKQRSNDKKVEVLKKYRTDALTAILIWNFDESVISMLPEGEVPYTPNEAPAGTEHTVLEKEARKLYYFIKGGDETINQLRRETMFVQMLEGLHSSEAEVLVLVKDKKLQDKYRITKAVVQEAFPQIKWGGRS